MLDRDPITIETIEGDRQRIQSLGCLQSCRTLRDKYVAHFDKQYFFDRERMAQEAPTWGDLEEVGTVISEVLNRYSASYDGQLFAVEPVNIDDLDCLLDRLHACRKSQNN